MKKLKLGLLSAKADVLNREQLRKIMGGDQASAASGSCSGFLGSCYGRINCCSTYVCDSRTHTCYMNA